MQFPETSKISYQCYVSCVAWLGTYKCEKNMSFVNAWCHHFGPNWKCSLILLYVKFSTSAPITNYESFKHRKKHLTHKMNQSGA